MQIAIMITDNRAPPTAPPITTLTDDALSSFENP